jgi:hypothetical protein
MSAILDKMFENLVIYVWHNPNDDDDFGAILVQAHDMDQVYEFTENVSVRHATSFDEFISRLRKAEIPFYIIYDESIQLYIYKGD